MFLLLLSIDDESDARQKKSTKTRAQTRKSLSLFLSFSRVVVVNNYCRSLVSSRDDDDAMGKQRTNERKFKMTRSLSPSKRHNKSTVTEEEDKKKRQQVPLSLSNSLSLSSVPRVFVCAVCIKSPHKTQRDFRLKKFIYSCACPMCRCPKRKKRAKRAKFLNFFRFWLPFLCFFVSSSLSSQKKENFSFTPVRRKSQPLSFASRASEYTHT